MIKRPLGMLSDVMKTYDMASHAYLTPSLKAGGISLETLGDCGKKKKGSESWESSDDFKANSFEAPIATRERIRRSLLENVKATWKPLGLLLLCGVFTVAHHFFNDWLDGKDITTLAIRQDWVHRIETMFSFVFPTLIDATMGIVLCRVVYVYARRFQSEDATGNGIERHRLFYTLTTSTAFRIPLFIVVAIMCLAFPLAAILASGALGITTSYQTDILDSCVVPSGNLSNATPSSTLYTKESLWWGGPSEMANRLVMRSFIEGTIPPLPQSCGSNCSYQVSMDSMAFQCERNVSVPQGQLASTTATQTLWNATVNATDGAWNPIYPFYVAWNSSSSDGAGTLGGVFCSPVQARYDFEVLTVDGAQSITYTVTPTGPLLPLFDEADEEALRPSQSLYTQTLQLLSIAFAARSLLLGNVSIDLGSQSSAFEVNSLVMYSGALLNTSSDPNLGSSFVWGDVASGIESMSHNITAALLTLDLGTQDSTCLYTRVRLLYTYSPLTLWLPYGIALGVVTLSLLAGMLMLLSTNSCGRKLSTLPMQHAPFPDSLPVGIQPSRTRSHSTAQTSLSSSSTLCP